MRIDIVRRSRGKASGDDGCNSVNHAMIVEF